MYSNKENINIVTSLIVSYGIRHAIVCPGSRNAPIVNNLNECPTIICHSVTDERAAGFYALGMAISLNEPVVVCVTSGSALLNLAPVVAEAFYQHVPLIIISADRPMAWIDQLDGQTLPQPDALGRFVKCAVTLPEPQNEEQSWYCNRLVNEAIVAVEYGERGPIHINIPISEPFFDFNVSQIKDERTIKIIHSDDKDAVSFIVKDSKHPMLVIGQMGQHDIKSIEDVIERMSKYAVVISECLGYVANKGTLLRLDSFLSDIENNDDYTPDTIIYVGGMLVSKRLKKYLRGKKNAKTITLNRDGSLHDTFCNLTYIIEGKPEIALSTIAKGLKDCADNDYRERWNLLLTNENNIIKSFSPSYSQLLAVNEFFKEIEKQTLPYSIHAANSMAVRLTNIYSDNHIICNRGVNGIEGCLSEAAGYSLSTKDNVFCIIGDLSFFYDNNALWNNDLSDNLRILLLNNGEGGIFKSLSGLQKSNAYEHFIAAKHEYTAEHLCQHYGVKYLSAHNHEELKSNIKDFIWGNNERHKPMLLEVFTNADKDNNAIMALQKKDNKK